MNKNKLRKFHTVDVVSIPDYVNIVKRDKWFWCVDGDPKQAIFYNGYSPQCNSNKSIVEQFNCQEFFPTAELIFIEVAYCPWDTSDVY